jgi:hypothetical protein
MRERQGVFSALEPSMRPIRSSNLSPASFTAIGLVLLATPTVAHAYAVAASDSTANNSRTIYAHEVNNVGVEMFKITFNAEAGEKRQVLGHIKASMPSTAADDLLMVGVSIQCASGTSHAAATADAKLGNTQNVLRGGSLTLSPQFVYTAAASGIQTCGLFVIAQRPRPAKPGDDPSNYFTVDTGSSLKATVAIHPSSAQGFRLNPPSRLLKSGDAYDAAAFYWTAPDDVTSFTMSGDVKVTTCTAVGGSRDVTTNGVNLCDGHKNPAGSFVGTVVQARQLSISDPSKPCAVTSSPATGMTKTFVSKDVHHKMIYGSQVVTVSSAPDCSRKFRIKVYVKNLGDPSYSAFVVHVPNSITTVIP